MNPTELPTPPLGAGSGDGSASSPARDGVPVAGAEATASVGFGPSALATPANAVTLLRVLLAPVAFVMMLDRPTSWQLFALWAALSFSDGIDGFLARRQGTTRSGAFLDPLADKLLVIGGLGTMAYVGVFPWLPVVLITVREVAVSVFRSYWGRRGLAVPASRAAKLKTTVQLGAVGWVTWPWFGDITWLTHGTLWVGVALAWVSGVQYFIAGSRATTDMERNAAG